MLKLSRAPPPRRATYEFMMMLIIDYSLHANTSSPPPDEKVIHTQHLGFMHKRKPYVAYTHELARR
jgi:hypothetical protein